MSRINRRKGGLCFLFLFLISVSSFVFRMFVLFRSSHVIYGRTLLINRGNGMASRICSTPHSHPTVRSRPSPKPECGTEPYLRRRSEEHTSELQSQFHLACRLLLEKN